MTAIVSLLKKISSSAIQIVFWDTAANGGAGGYVTNTYSTKTTPADPAGITNWPPARDAQFTSVPVPSDTGAPATPYSAETGIAAIKQIPFSQSISFSGSAMMASPASVAAAANFTVNRSGAIPGSVVNLRVVGDGNTTPVLTGFKEAQGNLGFDIRSGRINILQFFYDGTDAWVAIYGEAGNPAPPASTQALSNFAIASDGRLNYTVTGASITALAGTLKVNGDSRVLTHVSSGIATVGGAALTSASSNLLVTINNSTPTLTAAITDVAVTNSIPAPSTVAKRTITFPSGVTKTGDAFSTTAAGFTVNETINASAAFEVVYKITGNAKVLCLSPTLPPNTYDWTPPAANRIAGVFVNGPLYASSGSDAAESLASSQTLPVWTKFRKSGADVVLSTSPDGTSYTDRKTFTGILTGNNTLYASIYNISGTAIGEISFYA